MKRVFKLFLVLSFLVLGFVFFTNWQVNKFEENICNENNFPRQTALVLGARVYTNGQMSDIFKDRVDTALGLYQENKVKNILISGDHGQTDYDEVNTAKEYLLGKGVNPTDIFLDHAGFDTYDSLYRAKSVFQAESLALVTQYFHLQRALYIGDKLGLDVCGVKADLHSYYQIRSLQKREILAKVKAWLNVFFNSQPKYLGNKILLSGDGRETWD